MSVLISEVEDSTGTSTFNPDECSHSYGYDGSGNLTTDTAIDPIQGHTYVKTYTYTGTQLTAESGWVKQ